MERSKAAVAINAPSWSPDSREIAFVSYRLRSPQMK